MSILVTGGTGLIGANIGRMLVEQGRDVVVYDVSPPPLGRNVLADVLGHLHLEIGDVRDLSHVLHVIKKWSVAGIIHCAAILHTAANVRPIQAVEVNIVGTMNMLEAARIADLGRVVHVSSSAVYGTVEDLATPLKESDVHLPLSSMYSSTKLACEQLVNTYREIFKVDTVAIRPMRVYGPGQIRTIQPMIKLIEAAASGNPIRYETGGDMSTTMTYVKDFAKGTIQAFDCKAPKYAVYNLSFGQNRTMFQVCDVLRSLFPSLPIEIGPGSWSDAVSTGRQADVTYRFSERPPHDISRAREEFGFQPEWDLDRAIPDWVRWLQGGPYHAPN